VTDTRPDVAGLSFEAALAEVETIVGRLEQGISDVVVFL
jgi:exonuclease VII small subunit